MKSIVISGANRGLGLALTSAFVAAHRKVFAVCRPGSDQAVLRSLADSADGRVNICELDLRELEGLPALAKTIGQQTEGIDLLINNAGILTDHETIASVRPEDLLENYRVNTIGPVMLTQHLLPLLHNGQQAMVVNIASSFASITNKSAAMPPRYSYAMSKAALNMFTKTLAAELDPAGITVVAIHPGWMRTGIGGPEARFSAEEAAQALVHTIGQLTPVQSGSFLTWDGKVIPW
jgi:NAD(P)-dependent dehydrogenase (short-subunit alcohol dehydrogenase family)